MAEACALSADEALVRALIKSPRSIAITNDENRILRIPDSGMMFQQQRHLQDMLVDIHTDPGGFKRHIEGMRTTMKSNATAISSPVDVHTGCRDDYEMHQAVGKGRFSTVFYSREKATSTACAVKRITLSAAQAGNKTSYSKCLKEVGLLRNLAHPNIIKYSDSFLEEDVLFIVLEWAAGGDLKNLIAQIRKEENQLEEHQVWSYFSQCCEAVHHMHGQRIIHRDIKPSNVFIMEDGRLKLGDLGLGRYLDLQSILAFSQVGTPLYMSPEVLRGEGHDFASDIWSLGCVLYEMAMLRSPFQQKGLTMDRLFLKIVQGDYVPMSAGTYTTQMSSLVDSMLKTDPSARPPIERIAAAALVCRSTQPRDGQPDEQFELSTSGADYSLGSALDLSYTGAASGGNLPAMSVSSLAEAHEADARRRSDGEDGPSSCPSTSRPDAAFPVAPVYNDDELELMDELLRDVDDHPRQPRIMSADGHHHHHRVDSGAGSHAAARYLASPKSGVALPSAEHETRGMSPELTRTEWAAAADTDPQVLVTSMDTSVDCAHAMKPGGPLTPSSNSFVKRVTALIQRKGSHRRVFLEPDSSDDPGPG